MVQRGSASSSDALLPPAPPLAIYPDAVSATEEARLVREAERWLSRKDYEHGHFDRVIVGYREVQKPLRAFSPRSRAVLDRLVAAAFTPDAARTLLPVHVLDLAADGYIAKHVDHVGYSGESIVGLSLLSGCTMTLHHEPRGYHDAFGAAATDDDGAPWLAMRLPRRSLYVLRGAARYEWAHAVRAPAPPGRLGSGGDAPGDGGDAARGRRIALIFRDAKA